METVPRRFWLLCALVLAFSSSSGPALALPEGATLFGETSEAPEAQTAAVPDPTSYVELAGSLFSVEVPSLAGRPEEVVLERLKTLRDLGREDDWTNMSVSGFLRRCQRWHALRQEAFDELDGLAKRIADRRGEEARRREAEREAERTRKAAFFDRMAEHAIGQAAEEVKAARAWDMASMEARFQREDDERALAEAATDWKLRLAREALDSNLYGLNAPAWADVAAGMADPSQRREYGKSYQQCYFVDRRLQEERLAHLVEARAELARMAARNRARAALDGLRLMRLKNESVRASKGPAFQDLETYLDRRKAEAEATLAEELAAADRAEAAAKEELERVKRRRQTEDRAWVERFARDRSLDR